MITIKNYDLFKKYTNSEDIISVMFKNIGIYVRQDSNHGVDFDVMNDMINFLSIKDVQLFIDESSDYDNTHINSVNHDDFVKTVNLIIVFGGDGTLLNSARKYLDYEIPVLGINMGKVGFLTDIKVDNFEHSLSDILDGNYVMEERNLVSAKFNETHLYGLNEVVIHSGSYAQLMRYQLSVNEKIVYEQRSDGLIVATPTGSTAYALSAGGPIIHPSLDVWTILPMLPQSLSSRPFIISSEEKVTINLFDGPNEQAKICVDGQNDIDLPFNTEISISKMKKTLKLVHPKDNDFFEACREKLGWSLNISKS